MGAREDVAVICTGGIPVGDLELAETAELKAVPEEHGRDGEHPRWTAAMRQVVNSHDERSSHWRATLEAQARREREFPIDDDFGNEPTVITTTNRRSRR